MLISVLGKTHSSETSRNPEPKGTEGMFTLKYPTRLRPHRGQERRFCRRTNAEQWHSGSFSSLLTLSTPNIHRGASLDRGEMSCHARVILKNVWFFFSSAMDPTAEHKWKSN